MLLISFVFDAKPDRKVQLTNRNAFSRLAKVKNYFSIENDLFIDKLFPNMTRRLGFNRTFGYFYGLRLSEVMQLKTNHGRL